MPPFDFQFHSFASHLPQWGVQSWNGLVFKSVKEGGEFEFASKSKTVTRINPNVFAHCYQRYFHQLSKEFLRYCCVRIVVASQRNVQTNISNERFTVESCQNHLRATLK